MGALGRSGSGGSNMLGSLHLAWRLQRSLFADDGLPVRTQV